MATPKHRSAPGSSYFVTSKCGQGRTIFQVAENAEILVKTIFEYRASGAFSLHAFVVMPDHIHILITPGASTSLEKAVQLIKGGSSHRIHKERALKMELWQVGFHDWTIRDEEDWRTKVEYIHMNPVRARLVERAEDWPYSSASGRYTMDPAPERYSKHASGAKAPNRAATETRGLKSPPPEEKRAPVPLGLKPIGSKLADVGAEAPTPFAVSKGKQS